MLSEAAHHYHNQDKSFSYIYMNLNEKVEKVRILLLSLFGLYHAHV